MVEFLKGAPLSMSRFSDVLELPPFGIVNRRRHVAADASPEILLHDAIADAP